MILNELPSLEPYPTTLETAHGKDVEEASLALIQASVDAVPNLLTDSSNCVTPRYVLEQVYEESS